LLCQGVLLFGIDLILSRLLLEVAGLFVHATKMAAQKFIREEERRDGI
jgi:hypothetical protein